MPDKEELPDMIERGECGKGVGGAPVLLLNEKRAKNVQRNVQKAHRKQSSSQLSYESVEKSAENQEKT